MSYFTTAQIHDLITMMKVMIMQDVHRVKSVRIYRVFLLLNIQF